VAPRHHAPTHPIEIFAAGTHTMAAGAELSFSEADLAATAAAYDPAVHEAPLVVGHPKHDGPAYGWVQSLNAEGDRLSAIPHQVNAEFAELVRQGAFKKLSAAFYPPNAKANPVPGTYYLRHVGFLGAQPPSLKGLKPVTFNDGADDLVTVEVAFSEVDGRSLAYRVASGFRAIARIASGLRDRLIEAEGVETADRTLEPWDVERLGTIAGEIEGMADAARDADPTPAYSEETSVTDKTKAQPPKPDAALDERERKIAEQEAAFAEREARRDAETAIDALVAEGKVLPKDRDRCIAFMARLDGADGSLEFAEGGKTVKTSQRAAFKDLLSGLPKIVEFAELTAPEGEAETVAFAAPDGLSVDAAGLDLHRKAVAYQHANANVDYITAVKAVSGR
jgi:hypothetical protein